jgi:hypothetical protein
VKIDYKKYSAPADELVELADRTDDYDTAQMLRDAAWTIRFLVNQINVIQADRRVERKQAFDAAVRRHKGL